MPHLSRPPRHAMQVLRLLSAARRPRRAVSSATTAARPEVPDDNGEEDEGPFFDLDFSSLSSMRASSSSSSGSDSDDACSDLDFVISLHRSRSASPPSYHQAEGATLEFCASEPSSATKALRLQSQYGGKRTKKKRGATNPRSTLSFGASNNKTAAFYGGRPSFAGSARSLRLFVESPTTEGEEGQDGVVGAPPPPGDVIRRCLANISRRLRRSVRSTRSSDTRGIHIHRRRLRKSRSASAAVTLPPSRGDDSLAEKQDGIASAIAHCKESFRRASMSSGCDSSLLRSRSDPGGKCEAPSHSAARTG